jgi:flagellar export protein FliJ
MKKFVFTLETLLTTKEIQEAEIKKELALIEKRLSEEKTQLDRLEAEICELKYIWQAKMTAGVGPLSLNQFDHCFHRLREQKEARTQSIMRVESERTACQDRLRQAMTDVKSLTNLREQQVEDYQAETRREMENEIGEWVTSRRNPAIRIGG